MRTRRFFGLLLVGFSLVWAGPLVAQAPKSTAHERGETLYRKHCAFCHGMDGRANTPVGRLLKPPPRDFTDPVEMARVTFDRMYRGIKEGRSGTAMAAWDTVLTETEIGDLIDYIHSLVPAEGTALSPEQLSLEIGRRHYKQSCVVCHGEDGRADTEAAKVLDPPPRKFADPIEMARVDDGRMYLAIKLGVRGTAMASWEHLLGPAEIIDVMRYIRTLVQPRPAGMTQTDLDLAVGRQIYEKRCAACHGDKGNGQSRLGRNLVPRPRDFTDAQRMAALSDKDLARAITQGRPGTAMAPWRGLLNTEDVRRVILFIRRTFQRAR